MVQIPWPMTGAPGDDDSEGGGRLINVFAERRADNQGVVWRRVPGLSAFARAPSFGTWTGSATFLAASFVTDAAGQWVGGATVAGNANTVAKADSLGQWAGTALFNGAAGPIFDAAGQWVGQSSAEASGEAIITQADGQWVGGATFYAELAEVPAADVSPSWTGQSDFSAVGENATP